MPVDAATSEALHKIWSQTFKPDPSSGLDTPTFAATVAALSELGVNRYRIDFIAGSVTTYLSTEADVYDISSAFTKNEDATPGTVKWDISKIKAGIKKAQDKGKEGRSDYAGFEKDIIAGGVTDYTTYIDGKKVIYAGVLGDSHTELFPGATAAAAKSESAQRLRQAVGMVEM